MYFLILILPFLSFLSCIFFGRFIGINGCCILSTFAIFLTFLLSLFAFYEVVILGSNCMLFFAPWFVSELLVVN